MSLDVLRAANLVIDAANRNNQKLTSLKLQGILFFLQGFYLSRYGERLIDETFLKGRYGPIEKDVNDYFKSYGSSWLTEEAFDFSEDTCEIIPILPLTANDIGNERFKALEEILTELLTIPAWKLVDMSTAAVTNRQSYTDDEIRTCFESWKIHKKTLKCPS